MRQSAPPATRDYNVIYIRIKTPSTDTDNGSLLPSLSPADKRQHRSLRQTIGGTCTYCFLPQDKIRVQATLAKTLLERTRHVLHPEGRVTPE